jgi:hypothetical protein
MKVISVFAGLALLMMPLCIAAQDNNYPGPQPPENNPHVWNHGEIEAYANYFRFNQVSPTVNFTGVGGRVGFNANPNLALEANMTYDFSQNFTTTTNNGIATSFARTSVRPLIGLFGPKFQIGTSGPVRAFLTGKVGFMNFSTSSKAISGNNFANAVSNVPNSGTHFAFYPGAGVEFFGGPIGFRLDVGDQMYLNNGVNNDLMVSGGPAFRF